MSWLDRQLRHLHGRSGSPVVLLDPDGLADHKIAAAFGDPHIVHDYLSLRQKWELLGRRPAVSPRPVFVVRSPEFAEPRSLPWDIERHAIVAEVRWPVGPDLLDIARQLTPGLLEVLARLAATLGATRTMVITRLLRDGFGVVLPAPGPGPELDAVVRLTVSHEVPPALWSAIRPLVRGELALALCQTDPDYRPLQRAWGEWLSLGDEAANAATLASAGSGLTMLLASSLLRPELVTAGGLPRWTSLGASQSGPTDRMAALLDALPDPWPPASAADWVTAAIWWGDVRAAAAAAAPVPEPLAGRAEARWGELDEAFQSWLRIGYPMLFSSTRIHPVTLDQVAPFLARRHASTGRRQLLVLIDGLAFAQWSQLRRSLAIEVADATGCFAMCPTLTSVSRQAVFAGSTPLGFADSLWTTSRERSRWLSFWTGEGLSGSDVSYHLTAGATGGDVPRLATARIAAVVVLAVDDLMHGSEVLGDAQMSASLDIWARHGFVDTLLKNGDNAGFDMWITADHGNIEALPSGRVMEGLLVDHAGTRVRLYDNLIQRDTAKADGVAWDPPGLPPGKAPLFAPGRLGYHTGGRRVSHGGLSLDEVIVPFVRVLPR